MVQNIRDLGHDHVVSNLQQSQQTYILTQGMNDINAPAQISLEDLANLTAEMDQVGQGQISSQHNELPLFNLDMSPQHGLHSSGIYYCSLLLFIGQHLSIYFTSLLPLYVTPYI